MLPVSLQTIAMVPPNLDRGERPSFDQLVNPKHDLCAVLLAG